MEGEIPEDWSKDKQSPTTENHTIWKSVDPSESVEN